MPSRNGIGRWNLETVTLIKADLFTATFFIEMEFCNPNDKEIEGLYRFELKPGQVVTGFQLDLNGKYREGSIEEKWKATNAYNSVVGKHVDPALLTMDYADHYSLRIYPVPAKGCRKVTMTIQQLLTAGKNNPMYSLARKFKNFGKDNQSIEVENVIMDNQSGEVEIAETGG